MVKTCVLFLGLVMLAGARQGRPFPPDETFSSECDCEELRLQIKQFLRMQEENITKELLEAMQQQEQQAERRAQEAWRQHATTAAAFTETVRQQVEEALSLHEQRASTALTESLVLQEQKTASALQEVVRQVGQLLQERDEAARRRTLDERLQRMEEGASELGKPSTSSPEKEDAAAAGGSASLEQLERRVLGLEETWNRLLSVSTPEVPPATPSSFTSPSPSTSTSQRPPATTAPSALEATTAGGGVSSTAETPVAGLRGHFHDEQAEKKRMMERMKEAWARLDRVRAHPSSLGEALKNAAHDGSLLEVQRLLDEGADVNYTASDGTSPLIAATKSQHSTSEIVSLLLRRGADVNAIHGVDGSTALHWAAFKGKSIDVALLLAAGADANARDKCGETPLLGSVPYNMEASMRALLAGGARKDLKCWSEWCEDKTPFDVAESDAVRDILRP